MVEEAWENVLPAEIADDTVELVTEDDRPRCEEAWVGVRASGSGYIPDPDPIPKPKPGPIVCSDTFLACTFPLPLPLPLAYPFVCPPYPLPLLPAYPCLLPLPVRLPAPRSSAAACPGVAGADAPGGLTLLFLATGARWC